MSTLRERIAVKFWMAAGDVARIAGVGDAWWDQVRAWLEAALFQIDPDTAEVELVELLGWQRDIDRLQGESDVLFRGRVKNALANAKDAGGLAGFARIFQRLGLGAVEQAERVDAENWDVIQLQVDDAVYAANQALFDDLIRRYGRTCRRYTYETVENLGMTLRSFDFDNMTVYSVADGRK